MSQDERTAASRCLCAERGLLGVHEEPCAGFGSRSDELCEQAEREAVAAGEWPEHPAATARHWTLPWYWGRVKYELRWLPWSVKRVLRGESRWYAPVRALWHALVLMYECEICAVCGHPVAAVWHAQDELWMRVNGHYGGTTCVSCFNKQARAAGASPYWEVHDGEFPTCAGSPCVHVAPMMVQAEAAEECWNALVEVTGSRDAARAVLDRRSEVAA